MWTSTQRRRILFISCITFLLNHTVGIHSQKLHSMVECSRGLLWSKLEPTSPVGTDKLLFQMAQDVSDTPTMSSFIQVQNKCFIPQLISQIPVTNNGLWFCSNELNCWLDLNGSRHLYTTPRHPCWVSEAENLARLVKSTLLLANLRNFQNLKTFIENILLQNRTAAQASINESPTVLFRARQLRCSSRCPDSSDVNCLHGSERQSCGIITRHLGQLMVEITDLNNVTVRRRHRSQIHLREPNKSKVHDQTENGNSGNILTNLTVARPTSVPRVVVPVGKSVWQASQVDEKCLREKGCDNLTCKSRDTVQYDFALA